MKIKWHLSARADLAHIMEFISEENPEAAYRVHDEIRDQVEILNQYPEAGRLGRVLGTRELVISKTPYIVAYRTAGPSVEILRVLHGARRWPKQF